MNETEETAAPPKRITATEMRKLPLEERNRILGEQAILAEAIYRENPELSDLGDCGLELFDYDDTPATP